MSEQTKFDIRRRATIDTARGIVNFPAPKWGEVQQALEVLYREAYLQGAADAECPTCTDPAESIRAESIR